MIADDAELHRRCRTLVFDVGVTVGLWALVATGLYVANQAERAYLDRLSVVVDNAIAYSDDVEVRPRDKDDRYAVVAATAVAAPVASRVAALPIARPTRVQDPASQSRPQTYSAGAMPSRNEPFEATGVERFVRCMPECETQDPFAAHAASAQAIYRNLATNGSASQTSSNEDVVLHLGRKVVDRIVDLPRAALDTSSEALESLMQMVQ